TPEPWPNIRPVSVETMLNAVDSQIELIPGLVQHLAPQVHAAVSQLDAKTITGVLTTGCGDSLYAAMATRLAFEKYSGYRTEPIEALEFSRYTAHYLPKGSLVVGISAGGGTSRPVEAVRQAKQVGAKTISVTGRAGSPISQAADHAIIQNERDFRVPAPAGGGSFALGNYFGSMVALYLLAFELGRINGALNAAKHEELIAELWRAPEIIRATIAANTELVKDYARQVADAPAYYILGGGPSYATAMFMAAKLFEMPQAHGVPVELEEWAHEQYFLTRPATQVMVVAPPGNSVDRAREQIIGAKDMGGHVVAICDQHDTDTQRLADLTFPIVGELSEEFSPLTYVVPGELFAPYLCAALNKAAFEFISPQQYKVNMRQVGQSQMRL
ncbi:MAG TPA: SIS domain-containing protein, partial [Anaerolineae bacterium]|nr:SIS domain-containing protein [Anaerolineae bacterium]